LTVIPSVPSERHVLDESHIYGSMMRPLNKVEQFIFVDSFLYHAIDFYRIITGGQSHLDGLYHGMEPVAQRDLAKSILPERI